MRVWEFCPGLLQCGVAIYLLVRSAASPGFPNHHTTTTIVHPLRSARVVERSLDTMMPHGPISNSEGNGWRLAHRGGVAQQSLPSAGTPLNNCEQQACRSDEINGRHPAFSRARCGQKWMPGSAGSAVLLAFSGVLSFGAGREYEHLGWGLLGGCADDDAVGLRFAVNQ
jgi:hypothetical protein